MYRWVVYGLSTLNGLKMLKVYEKFGYFIFFPYLCIVKTKTLCWVVRVAYVARLSIL